MSLLALMLAMGATATPNAVLAAEDAAAKLPQEEAQLAAAEIADGKQNEAIAILEKERDANPNDPALLINLGIAYAQIGKVEKARALFNAALTDSDVIELDTADGETTDSRRLARKALKMLDKGAFEPGGAQLSSRD